MVSVEVNGKKYRSLSEAGNDLGINLNTLFARRRQGKKKSDIFCVGVLQRTYGNYEDHKGNSYPTVNAMAKAYGLLLHTFITRLHLGWSLEDALTKPLTKRGRKRKNVKRV